MGAENELHHHVWFSSMEMPTALREEPDDPTSCAWDLAVISHQQSAWVRRLLANPAGPDLEG